MIKNFYEENDIRLFNGDCLKVMDLLIDNNIKIDCIITDPPYGTTACKWDSIIPFDKMWHSLKLLRKENTPIILFGSQPFTSQLICSNISEFKYEWIWEKQYATNFMSAKSNPLKYHENIVVFSDGKINYNPQRYKVIEIDEIMNYNKKEMLDFLTYRHYDKYAKVDRRKSVNSIIDRNECHYGKVKHVRNEDDGYRNPKSVIKINGSKNNNLHPTQKPLELMEYLIKTYTKEGDLVLDFTMGSGTTGVACKKLKRKFIGIELDENYFDIAINRIKEVENDTKSLSDN